MKPVYNKVPEEIIKEYRSVVYFSDISGRIKKHSKNNIKEAHLRSIEFAAQY